MARKYASTVEEQRFYEAVIGKENETRLHIFLKNYEEREAAAKAAAERGQVHESRQMEVFKRKIERMSVFQPETLEACRNVVPTDYRLTKPKKFDEMFLLQKIAEIEARGSEGKSSTSMHPPDEPTKKILYTGLSKDGESRWKYLQQRKKTVGPDDKYDFPLLSSWEVGWGLQKTIKPQDITKPEFGRTHMVQDTFYTNNSVMKRQQQGADPVLPRLPRIPA